MMRIKVALAGGLALIAVALVATLAHAPAVVVRTTVLPEKQLTATSSNGGGCQRGELLPPGTTAIRLGLFAVTTPEVAMKVFAGPHVLTEGTLAPGWSGEGATVPVNRVLSRAASPVTVCFALKSVTETVTLVGRTTGPAEATVAEGKPLPGRVSIEYLRPSRRSWGSLAVSVARRLGLGRAASGTGNALLVLLLAVTVLTLSSWLVVRDLR
ncbi:MAG: hypothetical protein ACRDLF_14780 [Solirubrobacteraceae bacterium]